MVDFIETDIDGIPKRGIEAETCKLFGYGWGEAKGSACQVATFFRDGEPVFQKVRGPDKAFFSVGDIREAGLYGQHVWPAQGRRVIVTEGEIDALSVAQAFNRSWPVVSIPNGCDGAVEAIKREMRWLDGYDEIVLWFDNDEHGRRAADACARLFKPGKVKFAYAPAPHKDANDMLLAGDIKALCRCVYDANPWRPEGVVSFKSLRSRILAPTVMGTPWPWPSVTAKTYGRRPGEVYGFGAGSGVGKTDLFTQTIAYDAVTLRKKVGVLYLEQPVVETAKRIAGKFAGKRFHVPDKSWTQDELTAAVDAVDANDNVLLFDAFGATSWEVIGPMIRYMAAMGCEHIFLDHLTALAAAENDEKTALERIMAELAGMAQELRIIIHFVSHLATPEGKPHEEGGRVMGKHFKGSRAIMFWSHGMFGLERNTQADDPEERAVACFRCLKDRFTGNATGATWGLRYGDDGLLTECPVPGSNDNMPPIRRQGDF